jgi:hypothetical protein
MNFLRDDTSMCCHNYYHDFKEFKTFFLENCGIEKKYESYKVWAQWLIRNLCHVEENYHIIPPISIASKDTDIFLHLTEKGVSRQHAQLFYTQILSHLTDLYRTYHQVKMDQSKDIDRIRELNQLIEFNIVTKNGRRIYIYRYAQLFVKYTNCTHDRIIHRYTGDPQCLMYHMFEMGFNYYMLEGHSFQWCVPPKAFTVLEKTMSLNTELFASPINAVLHTIIVYFMSIKCSVQLVIFLN